MSADMHLIVFDPARVAVDVVREYMRPVPWDADAEPDVLVAQLDRENELHSQVYPVWDTPAREALDPMIDNVWVGQVSWAKAGDTAEIRKWVPRAVREIERVYARQDYVAQITPALITQVTLAFNLPHTSSYELPHNNGSARYPIWSKSRGISDARTVKKFMSRHMGAYTFVDSW